MIRRLTILINITIAAALNLAAQISFDEIKREAPDLDSIYTEITDRTSPYYYPRLMEEFERNDTTMTLDKYRRLYLGAMLQEDYDAYRPSAYRERRKMPQFNARNLTGAECDTIIKYAAKALADNPFDLGEMLNMSRAQRSRGNNALADIWNYKLRMLLMAIISTGTGADEENAWYVIENSHEYILLGALGLTVKNHLFIEPCYEYISVTDPDGNALGGFYFNIQTNLEEYWRKHPAE
ncbi:MAG: DUF4919 domain-containing protein [Paramuribaculum sp.]|nr:DUF4919 domain-containing protein [Bacteroides sp.]MDE6826318.1 DUF4919 domain-containing protein [Paramuribaculum sp.]MDE7471610.1 DUF4919 domain-containing protein [Paramuribaculum sp.]